MDAPQTSPSDSAIAKKTKKIPQPSRIRAGKRSNSKGKQAERDAAKYLRRLGFWARRSKQYRGATDSADLISPAGEAPEGLMPLAAVHIEIKSVRAMGVGTSSLRKALDQATREASGEVTPVVLWREFSSPLWRLTFRLATSYGSVIVTVSGDEDIHRVLLDHEARARRETI